MFATKFDQVAVNVKDMDRSLKFNCDLLGLKHAGLPSRVSMKICSKRLRSYECRIPYLVANRNLFNYVRTARMLRSQNLRDN